MRILIYAPAARMGGARAHVLGLVPELAALAPEDKGLLIAQPDLIADLPPLPSSWTVRAERAEQRGFLRRLIWEQRILPRIARDWRADVLVSFGAFVPLSAPCPTVLEAANALPFTRAFWMLVSRERLRVQLEEQARWLLLRASLRSATRVLVPTRAMRQDLVNSLPEVGPRTDVAVWGVADVFRNRRWTDPVSETVLGVSKHGINKEFDVLVQAVALVRERRPGVRLVLTGTPDESRWSRGTVALAARLGVTDAVCWAGDVPNPRVPDLIESARLLVFPTWCESFGLPLAEALAMGAPAVAADITACREVGGDAARYYDSGNATSLASRIEDLLSDRAQANALSEAALTRGQSFTWRANAEAVRATLAHAVGTQR